MRERELRMEVICAFCSNRSISDICIPDVGCVFTSIILCEFVCLFFLLACSLACSLVCLLAYLLTRLLSCVLLFDSQIEINCTSSSPCTVATYVVIVIFNVVIVCV